MEKCIAKQLVETGKLSEKQMLAIGEDVNRLDVWEAIVRTGKLSVEQMIEIGDRVRNFYVWEAVLEIIRKM